MTRTRSVITPTANAGLKCPELLQVAACNSLLCIPNLDCVVGNWSLWTSCSKNCGGGVQNRSRFVLTDPSGTGLPCDALTESQACNTQACVDCVVSDWSAWGSCSVPPYNRIRSISFVLVNYSSCRLSVVVDCRGARGMSSCLLQLALLAQLSPSRSCAITTRARLRSTAT